MTNLSWFACLRKHVEKLFVFRVFETEFKVYHEVFVSEVLEVKKMLVLSFFTAIIELHVTVVTHDAFIQT